jgi:site-specific recombinase XerD
MKAMKLIDEYLNYLEKGRDFALSTLRLHKRVCLQWDSWLDAERGCELTEARPDDLLAWIEHRKVSGDIQNASIVKELCVLRTLYEYLENFCHTGFNPAASLPEIICRPPDEQIYLSVEECFQLLGSFDTEDPIGLRNYVMVAMLWSTGLRRAELCALDWRDIDLQEATLLVRKGKGAKQRQLFLNDRLLDDLRGYRLKQGGSDDSAVFPAYSVNAPDAKKHARLSPSRLLDIIREHAKAAGLTKPVSPLTLRHTFATHMFEAGVNIEDLKEMMGHTDHSETTIYVHVTLDAARRLLNEHIANPWRFKGGHLS